MRFPGRTILPAVFEHSLSVALVVLAGILPVDLPVLFAGCADLLFVCSVVIALLFQGSFPALQVAATTDLSTTGFATRIMAIRVAVSPVVFGQGLRLSQSLQILFFKAAIKLLSTVAFLAVERRADAAFPACPGS